MNTEDGDREVASGTQKFASKTYNNWATCWTECNKIPFYKYIASQAAGIPD